MTILADLRVNWRGNGFPPTQLRRSGIFVAKIAPKQLSSVGAAFFKNIFLESG